MIYEIVANGIRTYRDLGMEVGRDFSETLPEPVTRVVDVPGAPGGTIDLTEALTGDVAYKGRTQKVTLHLSCDEASVQGVITRLSNAWHGRRMEYTLGWDPGYTYTGRFSLAFDHYAWGRLKVKVTIDADAFKVRSGTTYRINAAGGRLCSFACGRIPAHPTVECRAPTVFVWKGRRIALGVGTWQLRDVLFTQGVNEVWVDSSPVQTTLWTDLASEGKHAMTWGTAAGMRWAELASLDWSGTTRPNASWIDLRRRTWGQLATDRVRWADLDYRPVATDPYVYVQYEWKDL